MYSIDKMHSIKTQPANNVAMNKEVTENIRFVKYVKKYPCLYNFTCQDFFKEDLRKKAWSEVAKEFKSTVPQCIRKWNIVKNMFQKQIVPAPSPTDHHLKNTQQSLIPKAPSTTIVDDNKEDVMVLEAKTEIIDLDAYNYIKTESSNTPNNNNNNIVKKTMNAVLGQSNAGTPKIKSSKIINNNVNASTKKSNNKNFDLMLIDSETEIIDVETYNTPNTESLNTLKNNNNNTTEKNNDELKENNVVKSTINVVSDQSNADTPKTRRSNDNDTNLKSDKKFLLSLAEDMKEMNQRQKLKFKRRIFYLIEDLLAENRSYRSRYHRH